MIPHAARTAAPRTGNGLTPKYKCEEQRPTRPRHPCVPHMTSPPPLPTGVLTTSESNAESERTRPLPPPYQFVRSVATTYP